MPTQKKRSDFITSEEGAAARDRLRAMSKDPIYQTGASYSANAQLHPDHLITFVDKHMAYLCAHPALDVEQYLSNLRLVTRLK